MVIDFHMHLLPDLDDGADFISDSLQMARIARQDGTRGVVLTPHHFAGRYNNARKKVLAKTQELKYSLKKWGIRLAVFPAAEAHISPDLPDLIASGDVITINDRGRHVLVELPFIQLPPYTEKVLLKLISQGITPVLAHPERCRPLAGDLAMLFELVSRGVLMQVNSGSLVGDFGSETAEIAGLMVRQQWAHLIGSDAHSINQRPPGLSRALEKIESIAGAETAGLISIKYPGRVLLGREIQSRRPLPPPPRQL